jgi:superfamily I DNA/RNA helicase
MEDAAALSIGSPLRDRRAKATFRFGRNMRQSRQIGRFLQGFHEVAFGEMAPFDINLNLTDARPRLILAPPPDQPRRIAQLLNVLRRSEVIKSMAVLQINENEQALMGLRAALEALGTKLAPLFEAVGQDGVIITSVERIKGLEFDACIVLGLEDAERATLNFTLNRAYVGLSRPARRLAIVSEHTPSLLKRMDGALFDVAA